MIVKAMLSEKEVSILEDAYAILAELSELAIEPNYFYKPYDSTEKAADALENFLREYKIKNS